MFVSCSNTRNIVGVTFKLHVIIYWLYLIPLLSILLLHNYLLTRRLRHLPRAKEMNFDFMQHFHRTY